MNTNLRSSSNADRTAAVSIKANKSSSANTNPVNTNAVFHSGYFTMVGSALDHDVIELKKQLGISYEIALRWVQHRTDCWDLRDCRKALADKLAACGDRKTRGILGALVERYSLAA